MINLKIQSGDIQIADSDVISHVLSNLHSNMVIFEFNRMNRNIEKRKFTFQSGAIRMKQQIRYSFVEHYLHSNMVIFKFKIAVGEQIFNLKFTFQYGDIQMYVRKKYKLKIYIFTFQSGDIQITCNVRDSTCENNLHSNLVSFKCFGKTLTILSAVSIYIPIW